MQDILILVIGFLLFWMYGYLRILIHELGHALAALAVGWKAVRISVGAGSQRVLFRIGELRFQFGRRPRSGFANGVTSSLAHFRIRYICFVAGGWMASVLLTFLLFAAYKNLESKTSWSAAVLILLLLEMSGLLIGIALLEDKRGRKIYNDGRLIYQMIKADRAYIERVYNGQILHYAEILLKEGQFDDAKKWMEHRHPGGRTGVHSETMFLWIKLLLELGYLREIRQELEDLLEGARDSNAPASEFLDMIGCIPVFGEYPELLPIAVRCVDKAIQLAPDAITLKGTKGALLIELGSLDEGVSLLEEVRSQSESENDHAICSYYLVYARFKKGDVAGATDELRILKAQYPECQVAAKIEKRILQPAATASPVNPA